MQRLVEFLSSLLARHNMAFTTAIAFGALLFGVQALGLFGDHDHDADLDHDADHDHDAGGIPLAIAMPLGLTAFGFSGLFASLAFGGIGPDWQTFEEIKILPVLALAITGAWGALAISTRVYKRYLPDNVHTASDRRDLLGLVGTVISKRVDTEFGQVRIKDNFGHELEVPCVALDRERSAANGEEVVLVEWNAKQNRFKVVPFVAKTLRG